MFNNGRGPSANYPPRETMMHISSPIPLNSSPRRPIRPTFSRIVFLGILFKPPPGTPQSMFSNGGKRVPALVTPGADYPPRETMMHVSSLPFLFGELFGCSCGCNFWCCCFCCCCCCCCCWSSHGYRRLGGGMHHSFAGNGTSSWQRHDNVRKWLAATSIGVMPGVSARKSTRHV